MLYFKYSIISLLAATNAPVEAIDFANVAKYTSILSCTPCSLPAPFPFSPSVPKPCASSTKKRNLYLSFRATISFNFPCSPLIPKTPSEITRIPPPVCSATLVALCKFFSRLSTSLCLYVKRFPI